MKKDKYDEIDKYLSTNLTDKYQVVGVGNAEFENLFNMLFNSKRFDAPDRYFIDSNTIYIFEHFEIDSSKHTKKGSSSKTIEKAEDRKIEKILQNHKNETYKVSGQLMIENSAEYYLNELLNLTKSHYKHINLYKENVIKDAGIDPKKYEFKFAFIIEDTSILGTIREDNGDLVFPYCIKEYMEYLRTLNKIDFLICSNHLGNEYMTYAISKDSFATNSNKEYEILKAGICNSNPSYTHVQLPLKK